MTIYRRKGSPQLYTRFTVRGLPRVDRSTGTTRMVEALRFEDMLKHQMREQVVYGVKQSKTWQEAAARWLGEMSHKRTIEQDRRRLRIIANLVPQGLSLDKFYINDLAITGGPASHNRMASLVRAILNKACKEWGWLDKMPNIRMMREPNGRVRYLTRQEADRFIALLPNHLKLIVEFALQTGQRAGNIKQMQWAEINLETKTWTIPASKFKTDKVQVVPLNSKAIAILESIGRQEGSVFKYEGKQIGQVNTKAFRNALKKADIKDFRFHDLRHTSASWMVQKGVPLNVVQKILGHSSITTTQIYAHLAPSQLLTAVEVLCEA